MTLFAAKSDATYVVLPLVSLRHGMSVCSGSNIDTAARPNVYTEARVNYEILSTKTSGFLPNRIENVFT